MPDFEFPEDFEEHGPDDPYDFPPGEEPKPKPKPKATNGHDPDPPRGVGEWDASEIQMPKPRGWLLGNSFCRKFISSLIADGGVGKTALRTLQALALATGRPLTGEHVFHRSRVLLISLEDDQAELERRVMAAMIHHSIDRAELRGWLYLSAPGAAAGKLKTMGPKGQIIDGELKINIELSVVRRDIDLVILDPFVKTHRVPENSNDALDEVAQMLGDYAIAKNIAIDLPHHVSKGPPDPGNAQRGRGASALVDAGRLTYTLTPMASDEAQSFGILDEDRKAYVRLDKAKVNLTRSSGACKWFKLVGVRLDNGNSDYPSGDEVQTVEPWTAPDTFDGLDTAGINQVLNRIERGLPDGERYSAAKQAKSRAAWRLIREVATDKPEAACKKIIGLWLQSGLLVEREYHSEARREDVLGLFVENARRPA
jgi:hypothetical protein